VLASFFLSVSFFAYSPRARNGKKRKTLPKSKFTKGGGKEKSKGKGGKKIWFNIVVAMR